MKFLTLHRVTRGYDGVRIGLVHFLNPKSIEFIFEDYFFDPKSNTPFQVTAIEDKRGHVIFVEEDIATVQEALTEAKKW